MKLDPLDENFAALLDFTWSARVDPYYISDWSWDRKAMYSAATEHRKTRRSTLLSLRELKDIRPEAFEPKTPHVGHG